MAVLRRFLQRSLSRSFVLGRFRKTRRSLPLQNRTVQRPPSYRLLPLEVVKTRALEAAPARWPRARPAARRRVMPIPAPNRTYTIPNIDQRSAMERIYSPIVLNQISESRPRAVRSVCSIRKERRQVLHALGVAGKTGLGSPHYNQNSQLRCS